MMEVSSLEPEVTDSGVRVQCGVTAQYLVWDRELLEVAEDAYSPRFALSVQQQSLQLPAELERRTETLDAQTAFREGQVMDMTFLPDFPVQYREGEEIGLEFPAQFQMLYQDGEGNLQCTTENWTGNMTLPAGENSQLSAHISGWRTMDSGARMKLKLLTLAKESIPMITGLTVGEPKAQEQGRPSLILRRMDADSLWELAKDSGSTVSAIRKANHLTDEPAPGQMLLIPVS